MSYMEKPLSIRLPPVLLRELERLGRRQKRPVSDLAREALRRYVAVERFRAIRGQALPLAEAQGLLTDEDVFRAIS